MTLGSLLESLRGDPIFMKNVAAWERLPARPAHYADFPDSVDTRLIDLARQMGIAPLYTHQARAIGALLGDQNVALVTGTASGKSFAYHLPALQFILRDPGASILYLFPTKALAQDQMAALGALIDKLYPPQPIAVNIYDGDTAQRHRTRIRSQGGIVISNPDMLHVGILPYHARWASFFQNLRLVVLDEVHTYRGVFGSHMANVIRRLRRICRFYGSDPTFACASATIANPTELVETLIQAPALLIDDDGSPRGEKHILLYNPPILDAQTGIRRSYVLETRAVAGRCLAAGAQTIAFARSRLTTEVLLGYVRDEYQREGGEGAGIRGYRGGYLPLERREIERGLRDGAVRGVVATNALELGVDIGGLDVVILAGYPGTIANTWQQWGRSGRRAETSLGILVASGEPLDQYLVAHPRYLFERTPEQALINPDNPFILADHLRCAVYELPFEQNEPFGALADTSDLLDLLVESGELHRAGTTYRWISEQYPSGEVNLRGRPNRQVLIQTAGENGPEVIGEVDQHTAPIMVFEGAVYQHEARQFLITALEWQTGIAHASPTEVDYYTDATTAGDAEVLEETVSTVVGDCLKAHGRVLITRQATGYRIVKRYTHETLGYGEIDLPPQQTETTAYWVYLTPDLTSQLEESNILLRPNDYGPNWAEQRSKARERDGFQCTRCHAPERADQQHDVHHLTPFRQFGYAKGRNTHYLEANRLENLATLCRNCHRIVESSQGTRSALAGLANVARSVATLLLMCAPNDIGVLAEQRSSYTNAPTLMLYDSTPGGMGLSARLYDLHDQLLRSALELVKDCACEVGCPACVGPVGDQEREVKQRTVALLTAMIGEQS